MVDPIPYAMDENRYIDIQLSTARGIRKTRVRKETVEKKLAEVKGKPGVYGYKLRTYSYKSQKYRNQVVRDKTKYQYDPRQKAYVRYKANIVTVVKTPQGDQTVTYEELRYAYTRRGNTYIPRKAPARVVQKKPEYRRGPEGQLYMQRSVQLVLTAQVYINGNQVEVHGYSRVNKGNYEYGDLREQAERFMKAQIMESGGKYDYTNVEFDGDPKETFIKWVYAGAGQFKQMTLTE